MKKKSIEKLVKELGKIDYYELIRYLLGYKSFISSKKTTIKTDGDEEESANENVKKRKNSFPKILAYEYIEKERINAYYVEKNDFEEKLYRDKRGNTYSVWNLIEELDYNIVWNIVQGIVGKGDRDFDGQQLIDGKALFEMYRPDSLNFILGAGINSGYDVGNWDDLIAAMRDSIEKINGTTSSEIKSFEKDICNTNYIAPQILKDLNSSQYYSVLYDNLYGKYNARKLAKATRPNIEDTNLYQVVRILATQERDATVLTFNYDDILEQVFYNNFSGSTISSSFNHARKMNAKVEIIHSHGFFPYKGSPHSIVLSSYEYMEKYLKSGSYAKRRLTEQLKKTNLILGNSLADYEEQKVFFANHKRYRNHFDFIFAKASDELWMDQYKTIYFLKMGVIPVFFSDFDEMNDYLKSL